MEQGREDVADGKGKGDKHGKNRKKSGGTRYEKNKEEKGSEGDRRRQCHSLAVRQTPVTRRVISSILPRARAARGAVLGALCTRRRAAGSRLQLAPEL